MPAELTPKQEEFALTYVECGNASEAYRQAYDVGATTKPETVWRKACEVLANGKVAARVAELQHELRERTLVTVESITKELDDAKDLAETEKQAAAMTSAIMGKAKVNGLLVDRQETKHDFAEPVKELFRQIAADGKRIGS
jgi:phage terminase small subunit